MATDMREDIDPTNEPEVTGNSGSDSATAPHDEAIDYASILEGIDLKAVKAAGGMSKYIQSQADARATKAITTARASWEREQAEAQDEASRLAKMTEAERARYNFEKDKTAFEREREQFRHEQLVLETAKQMTAAGLPDLSAYVTGDSAEATKANIDAVTDILSAWKQEQLNTVMRGKAPKEMQPGRMLSKEDIKDMSAAEINKAWQEGLIDTKAFTK